MTKLRVFAFCFVIFVFISSLTFIGCGKRKNKLEWHIILDVCYYHLLNKRIARIERKLGIATDKELKHLNRYLEERCDAQLKKWKERKELP